MRLPSAFQYLGPGTPGAGLDVLGLWTALPSPAAGPLDFGTGSTPTIWRVSLSADPVEARAQVDVGEERIGTLARAISATLARFDEELPMWMSTLPADITARKPDERLAALLVAAGEMPPVLASGPGGPVPFGLLDRATLPFQSMLESVQRTLLHHAWVETLVGGRPVARTIVGWSGDLSTRWCEDRDDATVALHLRSLDVAMGSRDTVLKVFTLITQAALKIAALMAMPGGAILALPVAWRLVERIMRQLEPR